MSEVNGGQDPASKEKGTNGDDQTSDKKEISFEDANSFMKKRVHRMFYTQEEYDNEIKKKLEEAKSIQTKGFFETREKKLFENSGIPKNEGETYDEYNARVIDSLKQSSSSEEGKITALTSTFENKIKERDLKITSLEEANQALVLEKEKSLKQQEEQKALSSLNLDYSGVELKGMQNLITNEFYANNEQVTVDGKVVWKSKNQTEMYISDQGQPLSLSDAIVKFSKGLQGIKVKSTQKPFGAPNTGVEGIKLSAEQRRPLEEKAHNKAMSKGIPMNSKEYWKIHKDMGIDLGVNYPSKKEAFKKMKLIS